MNGFCVADGLVLVFGQLILASLGLAEFVLQVLGDFDELRNVFALPGDDRLRALPLLGGVGQLLAQLLDRVLLGINLSLQDGVVLLGALVLLDLLADHLLEFAQGLIEGQFLVAQLLDLAVLSLQLDLQSLRLKQVQALRLLQAVAVLGLELLLHLD